MPVFDAITSGYIITLPADVWVSIIENENGEKTQHFEWSNYGLISFHPIQQAENHPERKPYPYPKWINFWSVKTPVGYSCLFTHPMHRDLPFTILPGIVDTDKYTSPVNFPMVINDPNFQGLISKGTPIAQVIPFKREPWSMKIGGKKELIEERSVNSKLQTKLFDRYKSMFRSTKEYK
jgi:hypothetical protein